MSVHLKPETLVLLIFRISCIIGLECEPLAVRVSSTHTFCGFSCLAVGPSEIK